MVSLIDARLRREQETYRLRFACTDCAHFEPEGLRCSNGFPTEAHRDPNLEGRDELVFCKAFELY